MRYIFYKYFPNLRGSLVTSIFLLIPLAVFFSILSDRTPFNYVNILVCALLSVLILFYVFKYHSFKIDRFAILLFAFNIAILVSQIVNLKILEFPKTIILLSIFSIFLYQFFITYEKKDNLFFAILVGGFLFVIFFLLYYRTKIFESTFADRLGEELSDQNDLGKNIGVFAILSLVFIFRARGFKKVFSIVTLTLMFFVLLITGSISNLLTFFVVGMVTIVICVKRKNRLLALAIILVLALLVFLLIQMPFMSYFKTRIDTIFNAFFDKDSKVDGSAVERFNLFMAAMRLFFSRPLFGYGYDQVQYYTEGVGAFSHSNFAELLASFGIICFLIYETLLLLPMIYTIRSKKYDKALIAVTLYLFLFQIFLIIFRKKLEFVYMPLLFSTACYGYSKSYCVKLSSLKKVSFYKEKPVLTLDKKEAKKRLLFVFDSFEKKSMDVVKILSKKYDLLVVFINLRDLNPNDLNQVQCRSISGSTIKVSRLLPDIIDEFKPDYIHVSKQSYSVVRLSCFGLIGIKYVVTLFDDTNAKMINIPLFNSLNSKKTFLVTNSEEMSSSLKESYNLTKREPMVIKHKITITAKNLVDCYTNIYEGTIQQ